MANEKAYTGLTASVKIGKDPSVQTLAYISGFSLSLSKDIIEIISFGAEYKEKIPAIKDWSASVDGTCAFVNGGTQKQLLDAFESGEAITVGIYLDETTYFTGTGYVSSLDLEGAPDDAITISSEIAGSGAVVATISA